MKHISTLVNAVLAAVLILLVLSTGLPNFNVQAAATTPTVTADPTTEPEKEPENACNSNRTVQVSGTVVVHVAPDRALIPITRTAPLARIPRKSKHAMPPESAV